MSHSIILEKIKNIDPEDLYLVEKDLCFHEKVSIAFLLFADTKTNAQFILQKLLVVAPTPDAPTDILTCYTKINKNWRPFLVEALAIIKANKVLRKLGLRFNDVRSHFLPHIPEMSLHINPIVKALYSMCDMITAVDAGNLVLDLRDTIRNKDHFRFYDFNYLEMFLLDWITKEVLDVSGSESTNISLLVDYFKLNRMHNIRDILVYPLREVNIAMNDSEQTNSFDVQNKFSKDGTESNCLNNKIAEEIKQSPPVIPKSKCYKVDKESAGFVLIINQKEFHRTTNPDLQDLLPNSPLKERDGTDIDKISLEKTFSSFGYKPIVKDNLNHVEVLSNIREVVKRSIMYDSLIVCILTHGAEGSVYACDGVPIKLEEIEKILTDEPLIAKPKMLIVQACQGNSIQRANKNDRLETDAPADNAPDYRDMLRAMSTIPGFASLRHTKTGSWFIQTLCEKINELGDSDHMMDILVEVNNVIGNRRGFGDACMTSGSFQTLRKQFRLPSRLT